MEGPKKNKGIKSFASSGFPLAAEVLICGISEGQRSIFDVINSLGEAVLGEYLGWQIFTASSRVLVHQTRSSSSYIFSLILEKRMKSCLQQSCGQYSISRHEPISLVKSNDTNSVIPG